MVIVPGGAPGPAVVRSPPWKDRAPAGPHRKTHRVEDNVPCKVSHLHGRFRLPEAVPGGELPAGSVEGAVVDQDVADPGRFVRRADRGAYPFIGEDAGDRGQDLQMFVRRLLGYEQPEDEVHGLVIG